MFVVDEGEVAVLKQSTAGVPVFVSTLHRGDFGGLITLFEEGGAPRTASLIARTPVKIWRIENRTIISLARTNPDLALSMLRYLSDRVRRDNSNLARTLEQMQESGLADVYEACSPEERIILDTINHKVAEAASLEDILSVLFDAFRQTGHCDRLSLGFLQEDGNRVVTKYVLANYEPILLRPGFGQDLRGSTLDTVLESGEPRVINDLPKHLSEHPDSRPTQLIVREGMRSSMSCPLIVAGRPVGFLFRSTRQLNAYDAHQVRLHQAVARRLSQAAEKAWQIEQLKEANKAYTEMLGFVSHELKSPLGVIVMNASLLREGYFGELTDKQAEKVSGILDRARYLLDLVGDYLDLAHVEGGEIKPRFRPGVRFVEEVVEPTLQNLAAHFEAKQMSLKRNWEGEFEVECAPDLMQIVLSNLLSNAVKYGNAGSGVRLTLAHNPSKFRVEVWNEGPGFEERDRSKLFRKFSRVPSPELMKEKGTGIGLYTAWRLIQLHRGKIRAISEPGQWAEFIFEIPQPVSQDPGTAEHDSPQSAT
jgi:signal transduction histidine kinase/CRP-like cAMP-binding protein